MVKNKLLIRLHIFALALVLVSIMALPVSANKTSLVRSTIEDGHTWVWWPNSNSQGFYLEKDVSAKIHIELTSEAENVSYGLTNSSTSKKFGKFSGDKTSSATKSMSKSGRYKVYVKNSTAGKITVKGSSYISY